MSDKAKFHNIAARKFPVTVIFFGMQMEILRIDEISGPGAFQVQSFDIPIGVQMCFADGEVEVTPPPPLEVFDAAKDGDKSAYAAWQATLCDHTDPLLGVGTCWRTRGHAPPCEIKYFSTDEDGNVGVSSTAFNVDDLARLLPEALVKKMLSLD